MTVRAALPLGGPPRTTRWLRARRAAASLGRGARPFIAPRALLLALALVAAPALLPAQQITLAEAVQLAQRQGVMARAATEAVEAARWRERSLRGRLLPQLSLTGTAPDVNRSIDPVIQPDGTVRLVEQSQMRSTLGLTISQPITATGGVVFVESGLSRFDTFGDASGRLWQSTPLVVGLRQDVFRLNTRR